MAEFTEPTSPAEPRLSDELEAQIDAAMEYARSHPPAIAALQVEYLPGKRLLLFYLNDGSRFPLPVEDVEDIAHATDEQLSRFELEGGGRMIHFPDFDGNMHIPSLVEGVRGSRKWMTHLEAKRAEALCKAA